MFLLLLNIIARIVFNSCTNVFQKKLTNIGEHSSVVNLYTYLGLTAIGLFFCPTLIFTIKILPCIIIMGLIGSLGNFFIIKALSYGELSILAPINAYKPVVALIFGVFLLNETASIIELFAIFLIICGTFLLGNRKAIFNKSILYRFIALILSGTEAIFIKKVILATNIQSTFLYWALSGLIFSIVFVFLNKHTLKINKTSIQPQIYLIFSVTIMQLTTNYVFSKMNVAYALALFQLSTLVSIFLGANLFNEKGLIKKILASSIMLIGATILIFS